MLLPTSRCRAAATAADSVLLPLRCPCCDVRRCRCRRATTMLPPTLHLPLFIVIFLLILTPSSHLTPPFGEAIVEERVKAPTSEKSDVLGV